jgi:hypothetical protein
MATNPHFDFYTPESEQDLIQDLIVEAIQIYGQNVIYIPRNLGNFDQLYDTDDQSTYTTTIPVEMYTENIDGFQGQRDIYTKFSLEIRDSVTLSIARRTFELTIQPITNQPRPMEGDLVYFTVNKKCFQIKYVNNKEFFYPLGALPLYQLELNLFEYSDETFDTGIPEVDAIQKNFSLNVRDHAITLPDGTPLVDQANNLIVPPSFDEQNIIPSDDNGILRQSDTSLIDWSTFNPIGAISIPNNQNSNSAVNTSFVIFDP